MLEYISIGPAPPGEPCAQVGQPGYEEQALAECRRYIALLRQYFGDEPAGARLAVKSFPHDFGSYYEVVCWYDRRKKKSIDYAYRCEIEGPSTWDAALESRKPEVA